MLIFHSFFVRRLRNRTIRLSLSSLEGYRPTATSEPDRDAKAAERYMGRRVGVAYCFSDNSVNVPRRLREEPTGLTTYGAIAAAADWQ